MGKEEKYSKFFLVERRKTFFLSLCGKRIDKEMEKKMRNVDDDDWSMCHLIKFTSVLNSLQQKKTCSTATAPLQKRKRN